MPEPQDALSDTADIYLFALLVNLDGMALASLGFLDPLTAAVHHKIAAIFVVVFPRA